MKDHLLVNQILDEMFVSFITKNDAKRNKKEEFNRIEFQSESNESLLFRIVTIDNKEKSRSKPF